MENTNRKTFGTLEELYNATTHTNAQEILNGRMCTKAGGWEDVEIAPDVRAQVIEQIVEIAGGRQATRQAMRRTLEDERPQHWALKRMHLLPPYGSSPARLSYCAGQDYTSEMRQLRDYLRK